MQTDPQRVRRTDPGDPEKCPVWQLHAIYSDDSMQATGFRRAAAVRVSVASNASSRSSTAVLAEQEPMRERAQIYLDDPSLVRNIVADGCEKARKLAQETMRDVREAMGLDYSMTGR